MTFNCCQKPFFSHKRAQSLSKNLFLPLFLRKTMLLRRDICKSFAVYLPGKPLTPRQTTPYKSKTKQAITARQGVNSKPVGAKEAVRVTPPLSPHRWNTKTTPSAANKVAFKEERQGSRLRTLRLTGKTWLPRLPPPPWAHREKACPFPRNQQKVFFM